MSASTKEPKQTLDDAIARNAGIVLSLPSSGVIQNIKSRFLAQTEEGIWAELDYELIPASEELIETQNPLAVSFRIGRQRVTFATQALQVNRAFQFNEHTLVPAVLVAKPNEINVTQRRSTYRVPVFQDTGLFVRLWTIEDHVYLGDRPLSAQEIDAEITDASVGGLGIRIARDVATEHELVGGQRLRVLLKFQGIELLLDARLRFSPRRDNMDFIGAGVMFKKLDTDVDARQNLAALTHIVGELQQDEVRRNHTSVAS